MKYNENKDGFIPSGWKETTLGKLPESWKVISADEYCQKVADGTHDTPQQSQEGKFLVTSKHIKDGQVDLNSAYKISIKDFEEINKRSKVDQWDVLLSMIGTVGEICIVSKVPDFAIKNVGLFKCGDTVKAKWLFYYLRSSLGQEYLASRLSGTTQKYITLGELRSFPVPSPPLPEQKAIAAVLSSLDDKIELLQRQNKTLESIAQTIFKEWFINFKVNGKKLKINSQTGLLEGWRRKGLDEIADFLNGLALQKYPPKNESDVLPVIKIRELKAGITEQTDKASKQIDAEYIVEDGDVLFSWSGSLDVVLWCYGKGALNQHLFKVTSKKYPKWFYYYWILEHLPFFRSIAEAKATTMGHIQRHHLAEVLVVIPDGDFMAFADSKIKPIFEHIILNNSQIQILSRLCDALLPKLMKGEIRLIGGDK